MAALTDTQRAEVLADPAALRWISLSYASLVADGYWLRALNHFGDKRNHEAGYPMAEPLISRVLVLDPQFTSAYEFAATALTSNTANVPRSIELLREGEQMRPDIWRLPFYLGFNLYYFAHDYAGAADALARAAQHREAPEWVGRLATRLAARSGQATAALEMIDQLIASSTDAKVRDAYIERRAAVLYEVHLERLSAAVAQYEKTNGKRATTISELAAAGLVPANVSDPWGEPYTLDADGNPTSASIDKRLTVYGAQ